MFPVPTFPNLFHLITEPQRCKETLLQIFVPLKHMHQNQPLFLLLLHNGKGERSSCASCCFCRSSFAPHASHPPPTTSLFQWSAHRLLQSVGVWGGRFPAKLKTAALRKAASPTQRHRRETQGHKKAGPLEPLGGKIGQKSDSNVCDSVCVCLRACVCVCEQLCLSPSWLRHAGWGESSGGSRQG